MYRRPKFLEVLHEIREEMSREADYDMDSFAESLREGERKRTPKRERAAADEATETEARKPETKDRKFMYGNRF